MTKGVNRDHNAEKVRGYHQYSARPRKGRGRSSEEEKLLLNKGHGKDQRPLDTNPTPLPKFLYAQGRKSCSVKKGKGE